MRDSQQVDESQVGHVEASAHGRYLYRPRSSTRVLIGFHGYAENAEIHLAALEQIAGIDEWSLVAVQALHPFYNREQKVVASWMTRQDRDLTIADNVAYIRNVWQALGSPPDVIFLGFSQGAAMAWRSAAAIGARGVIALGGDIPPDVDPLAIPAVLIGRGESDDWYTPTKLEEDLSRLRGHEHVEICTFEGGHGWSDMFRTAVRTFLDGV